MYKITCDGLPILNTKHEDYIVLDPKVNVGVNTVGECTFKIYTNHPHYNDLQPLKSVFEVSDENGVIFRGRMTNNTRDFYNGKAVDLEGAMAFFNDSMVKPFVFPDDFSSSITINVVEYFLRWLINQHNEQVKPFQRFKLGNVTVSDPNNYISRSSEDIKSTWEILKEKLFESSLGGYLCIRYEDDGNYIDYLASFDDVNTQEIRLGQNLLDMKHETDATATYSAIIPIGADYEVEADNGETITKKLTLESIPDGKLNNSDDTYKITLDNGLHAIYSESAVENYGWICCPIEDSTWEDITDANNLKNKARTFLLGMASLLADSIEATAADLHFTDAQIRSFRIYKKVKVVSKPHGVADYYNLTKLEIDLLNPQNTKIVVGQTKATLTDSVSRGGSGKSTTVSSDNISTALGYTPTSNADIAAKISEHNSSDSAHPDIREMIENLETGVVEETDPTVPAWAKEPTKPTYTASEVGARPDTWTPTASDVGADVSGTAETLVSEHNTNTEAHNDIRLLIEGLTTRLNTLADSDDTTLDQMSELVAYIKNNKSLIDGITTSKVNVSDIIDNLTTNVTNKPLSAAQGVALKGLIDALQTALNNHTSDGTAHITTEERTAWNGKANQTDFDELSEFTHGAVGEIVDAVLELQESGGTPHDHTWDQVGVAHYDTGGDTITSDDVIYGGYHKVSECIPTYEDLQNGCAISRYSVSNGAITGELQTINFPEGDYTITESTNGVLFLADGIPMVLISYNGNPEFGTLTFPAVTEAGVYFAQNDNHCVHSLTINGYTGFPKTVLQKLPYERLPDEFDELSDWAHQAVDELVDAIIEPNKAERAFNLIGSDTLTWNGDADGKIVVIDNGEPLYAHVSNIVPTADDLQNGGSCRYIDTDEVYTFDSIKTETNDYIVVDQYNSIVIAKKDNVAFDGLTLPKKGIYLYYFNNQDYASHFTINGYTGFSEPILKMDNLTPHGHDWYGKAIDKGNTVRGDDVIHGGFVKVSDAVPTLAEVQKGGTLRFYNVENGVKTGDVIIANYLESPYGVYSANGQILIASNGITMVQIKADGVYFRQDQYDCVHSLTINEYTGFSFNLEKVPTELLPADFLKQIIREVIEEIIGDDTDGLRDINDDELYDALNRKLIAKE